MAATIGYPSDSRGQEIIKNRRYKNIITVREQVVRSGAFIQQLPKAVKSAISKAVHCTLPLFLFFSYPWGAD
ncbi:hypothetical protein [Sphingobium sp. Ant17]|uniref:hypothetical protein n=1 Tax=Sphingobium sp. Ant17 TaxID=1461752 RepID=UPI001F167350|nr:hypothetical protein [Sphingobium sp. Ant17]